MLRFRTLYLTCLIVATSFSFFILIVLHSNYQFSDKYDTTYSKSIIFNELDKQDLDTIESINEYRSITTCTNNSIDAYYKRVLTNKNDVIKCKEYEEKFNVKIGKHWGGLPKHLQNEWSSKKCNELINLGYKVSCDEDWGWSFLNNWLNDNRIKIISSDYSHVTCATNYKSNTFCKLQNVTLDFSKLKLATDITRKFEDGFVTIYDKNGGNNLKYLSDIPGTIIDRTGNIPKCDIYETKPTFIVSNDDIFNLGHYMNDVMSIWSMLVMSNRNSKNSLLINIDGVRKFGPATGPGNDPHRIMVSNQPDIHGPFINYYKSWFHDILKGIDYKINKVCFKELYFQPFGVPWFWNDWGVINNCAKLASSPLYQSFNTFLRKRWLLYYGTNSLPLPDKKKIHIVIENRIDNKYHPEGNARLIANINEIYVKLSRLPNVKITVQNFGNITFQQQVALAHSASILISMHGAGTTHIFHSAIGEINCCALIELRPFHHDFINAEGYQNLARMLGIHYYQYLSPMGMQNSKGTIVNAEKLIELIIKAINDINNGPICLHKIQDTTRNIYKIDPI